MFNCPVAVDGCQTAFDFNHLTVLDGLSQGTVYDVLQDDKGLLWIATQEGLNRYDGYRISPLFASYHTLIIESSIMVVADLNNKP